MSNPEGTLYQHPVFRLARVNPWRAVLSPTVWKSWAKGALKKYGIGGFEEDGHQMPGVFFLKDRKVASVFRYKTIADEPDYLKLIL